MHVLVMVMDNNLFYSLAVVFICIRQLVVDDRMWIWKFLCSKMYLSCLANNPQINLVKQKHYWSIFVLCVMLLFHDNKAMIKPQMYSQDQNTIWLDIQYVLLILVTIRKTPKERKKKCTRSLLRFPLMVLLMFSPVKQ